MKVMGGMFEIPDPGQKKGGQSGSGSVFVLIVVGFALFILVSAISPLMIASVGAGERGVKFNLLSGVQEDEFEEGWHIKPPWVSVIPYNVKTQAYTMSIAADEGAVKGDDRIVAISKDGLNVGFDVTLIYHIVPDKANIIHQSVGKDYEDIIIRPLARTTMRDIAGEYVAMDMHQKRVEIGEKLSNQLKSDFIEKNIVLEKVLVRSIIRPPQIESAIEDKLRAEQEAQKMEFVIQREEKEAERKRIEAQGIAKANNIIGESLTPNYLSWYWISNLDKHNSVIYVPISEQGFPIFKDVDNTLAETGG